MKKESINLKIIIFLFLIVLLMFTSARLYSLFDNFIIYIFLIFDTLLLLLNSNNNKIKKNYIFLTFIISFLLMIFSLIVSSGGVGSFLSITNFFILIYISKSDLINNVNKKILYYLIIIFYLLSFISSFKIWSNYISGAKVINPNTVALVILYMTIMLTGIIKGNNIKHSKLLLLLLFVSSTYSIINCHCRNSLMALIVYILILFVPEIKKFISKHIGVILWIIIITGIIFPTIYSQRIFHEIDFISVLSDKSIYSGREIIWKNMIYSLKESKHALLIGLGSHHITPIGVIINYHTWFLGIIYMYGIPIFMFYFYFLINRINNIESSFIKVGFISVFLTGIFETSAIWINIQFLIFILFLLDTKEVEEKSWKN